MTISILSPMTLNNFFVLSTVVWVILLHRPEIDNILLNLSHFECQQQQVLRHLRAIENDLTYQVQYMCHRLAWTVQYVWLMPSPLICKIFNFDDHNTLMFFGLYWAKWKLAQLSFYEIGLRARLSFCPILFLIAYIRLLEIILWSKRQLNSFHFFIKI